MLDALEYKINCEGQLRAHGGFDFSQPLGVTTIGQSREPINAWLPLYCTKQHWERVKVRVLYLSSIQCLCLQTQKTLTCILDAEFTSVACSVELALAKNSDPYNTNYHEFSLKHSIF